jgi:hypothetical protein
MGLRSPQDIARPQLRPIGGTELRGGVNPVSNDFIRAATQTANASLRAQEEANERAFQLARANLEVQNEEDRIAAQAELARQKGVNALDQGPKVREQLRKRAEQRLDKVPPAFKDRLATTTPELMNKFNSFAYSYEAQQAKALESDTLKQRTAARVNESIENSGNPIKFNQNLLEVEEDAKNAAMTMYGKDPNRDMGDGLTAGEIIKQYQKNAVSETILRSVQQQIAVGRFDVAKSLTERYSGQFQPADQKKAQESLTIAVRRGETKLASGLAEQAQLQFPDDEAAQARFIQANSTNDAVTKEAIQFNNLQVAQAKKARETAQKAKINELSKKAGKVPVAELVEEAADLPIEMRSKLINYAKSLAENRTVVTDTKKFNELKNKFNTMSPDEIRNYDFSEDRLDISAKDLSPWESLQRAAINKDRSEADKARYATEKSFMDIRDGFLAEFSRDLPGDYLDKEKKVGEMIDRLKENILDVNPRITLPELRKQIKTDLYQNGIRPAPSSFGNLWGLLDDRELNESLTKPVEENADDVHPSWIQAVRSNLKPGVNKTDDEIRAILKSRVKADLTKPKAR